MSVRLTYRDKDYEVESGLTVREAIKKIGLAVETTLAVRDGRLTFDNEVLKENDKVKLLQVISGG